MGISEIAPKSCFVADSEHSSIVAAFVFMAENRWEILLPLKNSPFDLDLIFAPNGIERFEETWCQHVKVEGFTAFHLNNIIAIKVVANQQKDLKSLPRLRGFHKDELRKQASKIDYPPLGGGLGEVIYQRVQVL